MSALHILQDMALGKCALRKPDWDNPRDTIRRLMYKLHVNGIIDRLGKQACEDYVLQLGLGAGVDKGTISLSIERGLQVEQFDTDTRHVDLRKWLPDLKRQGSAAYAGPCPKCGGDDRFRLKQTSNGWRCFCQQCTGADNRWMDAIEFFRWRDGLGFKGACKALALPPSAPANGFKRLLATNTSKEQAKPVSSILASIARHCAGQLDSRTVEYLQGRGINEDTVRQHKIGYCAGGQIGGRYVPRGIVIPCWHGDGVAYIKVRTDKGYKQVDGGHAALYVAGAEGHAAIVTETELDALMLACRCQSKGWSIAVYATGSVAWNYDSAPMLRQRHALFTAFDNDEAGRKATKKWGQPALQFEGKDVGDVYQAQGWAGIDRLLAQIVPPSERTDEAIEYTESLLTDLGIGVVETERGIVDTNVKAEPETDYLDVGGMMIPF